MVSTKSVLIPLVKLLTSCRALSLYLSSKLGFARVGVVVILRRTLF